MNLKKILHAQFLELVRRYAHARTFDKQIWEIIGGIEAAIRQEPTSWEDVKLSGARLELVEPVKQLSYRKEDEDILKDYFFLLKMENPMK